MERKTCSQGELWVRLEKLGSPLSFMAPERLRANTRPVLIRGQLMTDCSAHPGEGWYLPTKYSVMVMPLSHYFCSRQQQTPPGETEIWGRSEEARFSVGCAKWQLFKLKVTAGWIGLIYCQCQSSLTPFCVRACQRPGSDLFTSLH